MKVNTLICSQARVWTRVEAITHGSQGLGSSHAHAMGKDARGKVNRVGSAGKIRNQGQGSAALACVVLAYAMCCATVMLLKFAVLFGLQP